MTTTLKTWRVAFIGSGTIVQRGHVHFFGSIPNVEMVAICDINLVRANTVADEVNIPNRYSDYEQMLVEVQPDIVVIATPNIFHKPMAIACLEAGAHVLCEKPLAITYADAKEMMTKAAEVGRVLTVGSHYRWSTPIRTAKTHVDAGFFGDIYAARTVWHRRAGIPGYGSWFTNKDLAGAGSILDIGVHALDRALFLMGYPEPKTISGSLYANFGTRGIGLGGWGSDIVAPATAARYDVDDMGWAFVRFANGATLQFQVAWATHMAEQFVTEIYGTEGAASVGSTNTLDLYTNLNGQPAKVVVEIPGDSKSSYARLIEDFIRHLDGDATAEIVTPEQALASVGIIDGILRSAAEGREVSVSELVPTT